MRQSSLFPNAEPLIPFPGKETSEGVLIFVRITPKAASTYTGKVALDGQGVAWLKVYVTAPAKENQANEALLRFLAKSLGYPPSALQLIKGHTAKEKTILIPGRNLKEIEHRLLS